MSLDLNFLHELWPPARDLAGLQFATDADFARCEEMLWQDLDTFSLKTPEQRYIVVPKREVHRFSEAGLVFTESEITDPESLTPEERSEFQRRIIESEPVRKAMAEMVERLRRAP